MTKNRLEKTFEDEFGIDEDEFEDLDNVVEEQNGPERSYEYMEQAVQLQPAESVFVPESVKDLNEKTNKQLIGFSELLDSLSTLQDKKKSLWRQIYENAVSDRKNAHILFGDLYKDVHNNSNEHAIHGPILAKYMERMEKSNAQLIKLAEMIDEATEEEVDYIADEDSLYDRIDSEKNK